MAVNDEGARPSIRAVFANIYMRNSLFDIGVWSVLFAPGGEGYLHGMWQRCAEGFPETERIPADGLTLRPARRWSDWFILPVTFPLPLKITEPYFGAIAVRRKSRRWFIKRQEPLVRYLLLERGEVWRDPSSTRTVLGEWTTLAHLNYGDGPDPFLPAFLDGVTRVLGGDLEPVAMYVRPAPPEGHGRKG